MRLVLLEEGLVAQVEQVAAQEFLLVVQAVLEGLMVPLALLRVTLILAGRAEVLVGVLHRFQELQMAVLEAVNQAYR